MWATRRGLRADPTLCDEAAKDGAPDPNPPDPVSRLPSSVSGSTLYVGETAKITGFPPARKKKLVHSSGIQVFLEDPSRVVRRCISLAEVRVQEGEPLENALRRFKRKVQTEDIIKEVKRHSFYLKPGEKKRVKEALARKRNRKKARKEAD